MIFYRIFILIFLVVLFIKCSESHEDHNSIIIYTTGAEYESGNYLTDSVGFSEFNNASNKTDSFAHNGHSSIKLDSTHLYGFGLTIDDPKQGELYQASVWQKKGSTDGTLICTAEGKHGKVVRTFINNPQDKEWFKHSLSFIVGRGVDKLHFYVFSGYQKAYFDDVIVKRFSKIPQPNDLTKQLNIYIPDSSKTVLDSYIESALSENIIAKKNKKYVDAFIIKSNDSIPIKIRLKGDWTDHLTSGKISYRIKIKGDHSFLGLKTFSIQHPQTRNLLHEWFMHKLCDKENLLSTTYKMIPVKINGVNNGIYALEEHFDKQLLESRKRREGPILKIDESGLWAITAASYKFKKNKAYPFYKASHISFFKKNRTLKNKVLKEQMEEGAKLLTLFKNHYNHNEDLFDIQHTAKFYALLELGNIHHSYAWHNRRFYFNPISQKLEQIGFDMIPGQVKNNELYVYKELIDVTGSEEVQLNKMLFKNIEFRQCYKAYLKMYSDSTYLKNVFEELDSEIKHIEGDIAIEILDYRFDRNFYINRAKIIRENLSKLDSTWNDFFINNYEIEDFILDSIYYQNRDTFHIEEISLNTYTYKIDSAKYEVEIDNYHLNDVKILGYHYGVKSKKYFENPILIKAYLNKRYDRTIKFIVNHKPKNIIYKIDNNPEREFTKKVMKWKKPKGNTSRMDLKNRFQINSPFYKVSDSVLTFNNGKFEIDELLYIPSEYKVVINKGTSINFINGGGLIVNNSFEAHGTKQKPIHIFSSDGNNHGVTILEGEFVKMTFVNFESLNALHYKKWQLTGSVSIYESETRISNCTISNNTCEDGLNIIRSNFVIDSLFVSGTKSDGFDADFCTGEIKNSRFENTGNDCIDFSGSVIEINNIVILNSGDKGISGGERSELMLNNININGAITGIAAKDDTKIIGNKIKVSNAEFGVAAFQKKAEYNKASIMLTNVDYSNLQQYGLVDLGSYVVLDGEYYYGGMLIDIDKLYSRFEK